MGEDYIEPNEKLENLGNQFLPREFVERHQSCVETCIRQKFSIGWEFDGVSGWKNFLFVHPVWYTVENLEERVLSVPNIDIDKDNLERNWCKERHFLSLMRPFYHRKIVRNIKKAYIYLMGIFFNTNEFKFSREGDMLRMKCIKFGKIEKLFLRTSYFHFKMTQIPLTSPFP